MVRSKWKAHSSLGRRELLSMLGVAGFGLIGKRGNAAAGANERDAACTLSPEQTEGPYFVDERLNRSDLRTSTSGGAARRGVPLVLTLRVYGSSAGHCAPLAGAVVDIWHCDASGAYSDVGADVGSDVGAKAVDRRAGASGEGFLRGYQVTDTNGEVRFRTIVPGRYAFRATHIHLKVRQLRSPTGTAAGKWQVRQEFTSQLYFDETILDAIYSQPPYVGNTGPMRNIEDPIFARSGGPRMIVPLAKTGDGYAGTYRIAVRV